MTGKSGLTDPRAQAASADLIFRALPAPCDPKLPFERRLGIDFCSTGGLSFASCYDGVESGKVLQAKVT